MQRKQGDAGRVRHRTLSYKGGGRYENAVFLFWTAEWIFGRDRGTGVQMKHATPQMRSLPAHLVVVLVKCGGHCDPMGVSEGDE
jgi:hypothetical protein